MEIEKQFNLVAQEYDRNRRLFIPCFDEYYDKTTKFLVSRIKKAEQILDLGAGTGLLSAYWYENLPDASYTLVDIASDMLDKAKERFYGKSNVHYMVSDYGLEFPNQPFDVIISALSIHHFEDEAKKDLFRNIYQKLPQNGVFVNYDQFCGEDERISQWFDTYWVDSLLHSELSQHDISLWKERRKLDKECSVKTEMMMLQDAGFEHVECVYLNRKFAVILAIK